MATATVARWLTAGALSVAGLAVAAPGPAQAAVPAGTGSFAVVETYLLTRPFADSAQLNQIGADGITNGLWTSYRLRSGFAGYDLLVTHQQRTTLRPTSVYVYTAPFGGECTTVGNRGKTGKVWLSFTCQSGFAGDDLRVR